MKVVEHRGEPCWRRLGRSKARAELVRATEIARRGIPTPIPVAAGERRRHGLLVRGYELVPWLSEAIDLRRALDDRVGTPAERRALPDALGRLVRRMHDAGIDQEDLAPNNFLWSRGAEPALLAIDFERARVATAIGPERRIRALAKLDRHCAGVPAAARMRFLLAYAGGRDAARAHWRDVERAAAALFRRDAKRWARTAQKSGRRFATLVLSVDATAWRGWMRRDAPLDAIRAALVRDAERAGALLVRRLPADADVARLSGVALALHQRAALPAPVALLTSGAETLLILRTAEPLVPLRRDARLAATVLLDRLLAWGALRDAGPEAFAANESGSRVWLLDPTALAPQDAAPTTGRRRDARARAAKLCGGPEPGSRPSA